MEREVLRVYISAILADSHLNYSTRLTRLAKLAQHYLDANKQEQCLDDLFHQWNVTMTEVIVAYEATHKIKAIHTLH